MGAWPGPSDLPFHNPFLLAPRTAFASHIASCHGFQCRLSFGDRNAHQARDDLKLLSVISCDPLAGAWLRLLWVARSGLEAAPNPLLPTLARAFAHTAMLQCTTPMLHRSCNAPIR